MTRSHISAWLVGAGAGHCKAWTSARRSAVHGSVLYLKAIHRQPICQGIQADDAAQQVCYAKPHLTLRLW